MPAVTMQFKPLLETLSAAERRSGMSMVRPPRVATPDLAGPGCTVVDRWLDDGGNRMAFTPSAGYAGAGGATPCWTLVDDAATWRGRAAIADRPRRLHGAEDSRHGDRLHGAAPVGAT